MRKRTAARGYGAGHQAERERWRPKVDAGITDCASCGQPIEPGRPWDLGHNEDRTGWTGPEHTHCNRRAGGRNGAKVSNAMRTQPPAPSRDW